MTTMTISLPENLKTFLETQATEEGHASADDYLRALIREARREKLKRIVYAKIDEGLASGLAEPMTREDWDALERRAREGLRGESIKP